jgi:hypothetical protein
MLLWWAAQRTLAGLMFIFLDFFKAISNNLLLLLFGLKLEE